MKITNIKRLEFIRGIQEYIKSNNIILLILELEISRVITLIVIKY